MKDSIVNEDFCLKLNLSSNSVHQFVILALLLSCQKVYLNDIRKIIFIINKDFCLKFSPSSNSFHQFCIFALLLSCQTGEAYSNCSYTQHINSQMKNSIDRKFSPSTNSVQEFMILALMLYCQTGELYSNRSSTQYSKDNY